MAGEEGIPGFLGADLRGEFVIDAGFGFRIDGLRGWRDQRHGFAAERSVDERLLTVAGAFQHVVAYPAEREAQIEPRLGDVFDQRGGERTVVAVAVARHRAGLGGEGDQRVGHRRFDLREPSPDRAAGDAPLHRLGKGIVTAGVEDHQLQPLGALERLEHAVERDGLVLDVEVATSLASAGTR